MIENAEFIVENGQTAQGVTAQFPEADITLPEMPLDERRVADLEFLDSLKCTPEMIAEQLAELTNAGE